MPIGLLALHFIGPSFRGLLPQKSQKKSKGAKGGKLEKYRVTFYLTFIYFRQSLAHVIAVLLD